MDELKQKSLVTPTGTIQYWTNEKADTPTILLMHGAAMDHYMFEPQLPLLTKYNVIAWDARGHGLSQPNTGPINLASLAKDALEIFAQESAKDIILIGQSEGGMVAQELYRQKPDAVKAIVTIGASPIMIPYTRLDIWLLKFSTSIIKLWPYNNFMQALARTTAIKKPTQKYALKAVKAISKTDFLKIWEGVTTSLSTKGIPDFHIRVPLLIAFGDKDYTGTVKNNNRRWKAYEPSADREIIPDAGHNANQDNPEFFNAKLKDFLRKSL